MPLSTKTKIALARLVQLPIIGAGRVVGRSAERTVRRRGIRWDLDLREGIDLAIYLFGAFEPGTVRAYTPLVPVGGTVIDVGANIGAHTLQFARLVGPQGRVLAFEPTDYAIAKLRRNLERNPDLERVVAVEQAMLLPDLASTVAAELESSWPVAAGDDVHDSLRGRAQVTTGARPETVDHYLSVKGIDRVDLVKMDVDGFEVGVLEGARETLRRYRPPIVMELAPYLLDERGSSLEALLSVLDSVEYGFVHLGSETEIPFDPAALRSKIPPGSSVNVVARAHS